MLHGPSQGLRIMGLSAALEGTGARSDRSCAHAFQSMCDRGTKTMDKVPMTAAGHAALTDELKRRQSVERPRIIEHIAEARSHGDLSENAEYHAAKEEQSHNEGRIAELEDKLARADVIDISKLS